MDAAAAFERLIDYEIGEVTAAATYYLAETHMEFSRSLMSSERPPGLQDAELADYVLALEEEAFPFEEQAIAIHEKNMELVRAGTLNTWTDRSLSRLAELVPVRYAKDELSSGYLGSIERYAYITPAVPQSASAVQPAVEPPKTTGLGGKLEDRRCRLRRKMNRGHVIARLRQFAAALVVHLRDPALDASTRRKSRSSRRDRLHGHPGDSRQWRRARGVRPGASAGCAAAVRARNRTARQGHR
jgi:hypothetical protein